MDADSSRSVVAFIESVADAGKGGLRTARLLSREWPVLAKLWCGV